jgi:hypothetical protein
VAVIELLVVVKAYPNPSRKYGETSCIAGIELREGVPDRWIRLYPVPFRSLEDERRFRKYEVIEVEVSESSNDRRPESRKANIDTIRPTGRFLPSGQGWRRRRPVVEPLIRRSMCEISELQASSGVSLGIFRPREVTDLMIEEMDVEQEKQRLAESWAAQGSLLDPTDRAQQRRAIEQLPYAFKYRYRCVDESCRGHVQTVVDWEIAQLYRQIKGKSDWRERLRRKWLGQLCGTDKDTAFVVGNQFLNRRGFLVLGVWWPPRQKEQLRLT